MSSATERKAQKQAYLDKIKTQKAASTATTVATTFTAVAGHVGVDSQNGPRKPQIGPDLKELSERQQRHGFQGGEQPTAQRPQPPPSFSPPFRNPSRVAQQASKLHRNNFPSPTESHGHEVYVPSMWILRPNLIALTVPLSLSLLLH